MYIEYNTFTSGLSINDWNPEGDYRFVGNISTTNGDSAFSSCQINPEGAGSNASFDVFRNNIIATGAAACNAIAGGGGNINGVAKFMSASYPWNFRLAADPGIDDGESQYCPPMDIQGVARPIGTACDIGAYEG
jgi:hypothetical protein